MMVPHPSLGKLRRWDPERIGPFALLGRLGAGAMGQVYLGRSQAGRLVAVKTIKIELAEEPGFRDHFAHEVAAARRVSGMFTAAVVAADADADVPWLATTYVPAPSLSRLVKSVGPQPLPAIWWLAAGCAEALESIHNAGLVHRDLKPSNVLVAPSGPLVIDFGVARAAERIQLTVTRGAVGTPAYMAPEQARDTRQASMASDVFALGATLLYAATGHPPYQGETVMDVLVRLATEPPDLSGLAPELTHLITACLERRPADRPTSAALLAELGPMVSDGLHLGPPADTPHPYLAEPAMALIAEFHTGPGNGVRARPADRADPDPADASHLTDHGSTGHGSTGHSTTDDSAAGQTDLRDAGTDGSETSADGTYGSRLGADPEAGGGPGSRARSARHRRDGAPVHEGWAATGVAIAGAAGGTAAVADGAAGGSGTRRARGILGRRGRPRSGRNTPLSVPVRVGLAVGLIAVGVITGALTSGFGRSGPASDPNGASAAAPGSRGHALPSGFPPIPTGKPAIALLQSFGDPATVFLVHGVHWRPRTKMTIEITGVGVSPVRPVVDMSGSFNYAIGQDHDFFSGLIPPGQYHVVVIGTPITGSGTARATGTFEIFPPPPPGGLPPPPPGSFPSSPPSGFPSSPPP
jgi:serine/threonine protein kinase